MPDRKAVAPLKVRARLFDADRTDHEVELKPGLIKHISDRQLLWIDVTGTADDTAVPELQRLLPGQVDELARLSASDSGPRLDLHGDYFMLRVLTLDQPGDAPRGRRLDMLAGTNLMITRHDGHLTILETLDERVKDDTALGQIDSTGFVAVVLEALVTEYLTRVDEVEAAVDKLDAEALRTSSRNLLDDMVELRHRIARLRRQITAHRTVFSSLAGADFETVNESVATARFQPLAERLQVAIDAVDASRDALVGTFDIHSTRTGQRTNDIMKTLTIVNVLLLPAVVIAGFMGMNEKTPFPQDDPIVFWIVCVVIVALAAATLIALRLRHWL